MQGLRSCRIETFRNYFYQSSIIPVRSNISHIFNLFTYQCWSCFQRSIHPFAFWLAFSKPQLQLVFFLLLNLIFYLTIRPCIILVNDSDPFPDSSTLSQTFKSAKPNSTKAWSSNSSCHCHSEHWLSPTNWSWWIISLALFCCSMGLASSFNHFRHYKWGPTSSIAVAKFFYIWGIILFWVAHEFNICFI